VSEAVVIALALLGLLVGGAVWVVARNQAMRRPLFSGPYCDGPLSINISPATAKTAQVADSEAASGGDSSKGKGCSARLPAIGWLPLYGFGFAWMCPTCGRRQSLWRVAFEVLYAVYFAVAAWRIDDWLSLVSVLVFSIPLSIILLVDAWTRLIYTTVIYSGILAGFAFALAEGIGEFLRSVGGMVAAAAIFGGFYILALAIYRNVRVIPFGRGDIYLAAMIGAMVRIQILLGALFYGIALAGIAALLILATRRAGRRQAMPYGPFLSLGALIALVL